MANEDETIDRGKVIHDLFEKWNKSDPPCDTQELWLLRYELLAISGFLRAQGMKPLATYYERDAENILDCIKARHQNQS